MHKPVDLPKNAPLIFVLHGYTGSAAQAQNSYGMNAIADAKGFVVCYPQGTKDYSDRTHWNARLTISDTDDIGFLSELAKHLQKEHNLDSANTFSCGMSNGGFMSYTLACEASNVFNAIASVTGTMSGYTWENCNPERPIPVMQIHGVDDSTVPIEGSITPSGGWGGGPHLDQVVEYWAEKNLCSTLDSAFLPNSTNAYYYGNGLEGNQVWYRKISNWGHAWPKAKHNTGTVASELIWEFFSLVIDKQASNIEYYSPDRNGLLVYPNPTESVVNIRNAEQSPSEYSLWNILGKKVLSGSNDSTSYVLDVSNLPKGVYLLVVDGVTKRIVKSE